MKNDEEKSWWQGIASWSMLTIDKCLARAAAAAADDGLGTVDKTETDMFRLTIDGVHKTM